MHIGNISKIVEQVMSFRYPKIIGRSSMDLTLEVRDRMLKGPLISGHPRDVTWGKI